MSRYDESKTPTDEEIARMLALPEDDPQRRAWESDPRHRAIARGYEAFLAGDDASSPRAEEATQALRRSLHAEVRASAPRPFPTPARWAMAAVLAVAVGVGAWVMKPDGFSGGEPTGVLRGAELASDALALGAMEWKADGSLELHWTAEPVAERYRVQVFDAQLGELLRQETETNSLTVPAGEWASAPHPPALWSVSALRDHAVVGTSEVGEITARPR